MHQTDPNRTKKKRGGKRTDVPVPIVRVLDGQIQQRRIAVRLDLARRDVHASDRVAHDRRKPNIPVVRQRAHHRGSEQRRGHGVFFDLARGGVQTADFLAQEFAEPDGGVGRHDDPDGTGERRGDRVVGLLVAGIVKVCDEIGRGLSEPHL